MRTCKVCNVKKDESNYYKKRERKDGLQTECKECRKIIDKKYASSKKERNKRWAKENKEKNNQRLYRYYGKGCKGYKKALVRAKTNRLVKTNKIKKFSCNHCGEKKSEAHHNNYENAYDITWLCRECHTKLHKKLKQIEYEYSTN